MVIATMKMFSRAIVEVEPESTRLCSPSPTPC